MKQETARILWNRTEAEGYFRIGLTCNPSYENAVAGQFVTVSIPGRFDPLLRRPFSIHRLLSENGRTTGLEILYRVVGNFTRQLAEKREGETVDLLGPLGRGFTITPGIRKPFLIAGGIGVAPIVFLAESLYASGIDLSEGIMFLGGRTSDDILCEKDFTRMNMPVEITTEDGSRGRKGLITEPLKEALEQLHPGRIYACGPHGLLHAVSDIALEKDIDCEISIETVMACGLGVCMGCAVKTTDVSEGYRHVCKHGPVFDARALTF